MKKLAIAAAAIGLFAVAASSKKKDDKSEGWRAPAGGVDDLVRMAQNSRGEGDLRQLFREMYRTFEAPEPPAEHELLRGRLSGIVRTVNESLNSLGVQFALIRISNMDWAAGDSWDSYARYLEERFLRPGSDAEDAIQHLHDYASARGLLDELSATYEGLEQIPMDDMGFGTANAAELRDYVNSMSDEALWELSHDELTQFGTLEESFGYIAEDPQGLVRKRVIRYKAARDAIEDYDQEEQEALAIAGE